MDFGEIKKINEIMKLVKQMQQLKKTLDQVNELSRQQQLIRQFVEEHRDQFWRGEVTSKENLESLREQCGYDQKTWELIVRELLGEPPPNTLRS